MGNPRKANGAARRAIRERWRAIGDPCHICGKPIDYKYSQLHHVLPYSRMGQFATDERNVLLLCHDCHQEIHSNPLKQVEMMQKKADELGVDLKDFYDYGNIGSGKA